jgi:predicted metal-binding protein
MVLRDGLEKRDYLLTNLAVTSTECMWGCKFPVSIYFDSNSTRVPLQYR